MKRDPEMQSKIVAAVKSIEDGSSIEVVVTLSPRTIRSTVPILASALGVCIIFLSIYPIFFKDASPITVTADIFGVSAFAALLVGTLPPLQRLFFRERRMRDAAVDAAQAAFVRQGIHCTMRRTGLLLYLSAFEREVVLIPDVGIKAMIPADELKRLEEASAIYKAPNPDVQLTVFFELLREIAVRYLPKQDDDINELSDELQCL